MKHLSRTMAFIAIVVTATATIEAAEFNTVLSDKSALTFTSRQMGVPVQGRFPRFTARIAFDPTKPEAATVGITIDVSSIDAGSKDANDEVVGSQWFNVKTYPAASFSSSTIKSLGGGRYEVSGPLTIKGKSLPITTVFTFKADGATGIFDGSFTLKRIDYAIGEGPWLDVSLVANDIQVSFRIVATSANRK